ncbi:MAG: 50S ribosomal protein L29 [Marinicellaceae bacterium]
MNVTELKTINPSELANKLAELQKAQFDLRMAKGNGQLTKNHTLKEVRRDIARVKTLIRENDINNLAGNK